MECNGGKDEEDADYSIANRNQSFQIMRSTIPGSILPKRMKKQNHFNKFAIT